MGGGPDGEIVPAAAVSRLRAIERFETVVRRGLVARAESAAVLILGMVTAGWGRRVGRQRRR